MLSHRDSALSNNVYEFGKSLGPVPGDDMQFPFRAAMSEDPRTLLEGLGVSRDGLDMIEKSRIQIEQGGRPFISPEVARATKMILFDAGFWAERPFSVRPNQYQPTRDAFLNNVVPDCPSVLHHDIVTVHRFPSINHLIVRGGTQPIQEVLVDDGAASEVTYDSRKLTPGHVAVVRAVSSLAFPWAKEHTPNVVRLSSVDW